MIEMTLPSGHRIRNSSPGGFFQFEIIINVLVHSDLRDYISDTTRSFRGMHAWRLTRFISR